MKRYLLIHYAEIGLKKKNTAYFVGKLRQRIKLMLEQNFKKTFVIKHSLARFLVELPPDFDEAEYAKILKRIFGIKNFKFVFEGSINLEKLGEQIWDQLPKDNFANFRVSAKRSMDLPYKSMQAQSKIGAILLKKGINLPVKMKDVDLIIDIEFLNNHGYFSFKKYYGAGGLSPNSQGKLVALISAGIDSPVASYLMMKRGARIIFVHFHGYPYTDKEEITQVKDLVKILSDYQADTKLYLIPYGQFQRAISTNLKISARVRTILYRRTMLRVAEAIARKKNAKGLVTGDSFGQVASQTPYNIFAIHDASTIPLFQPLIGFDKEETIKIAEEIGTYEISKLPCKDNCTMFAPEKVEIMANTYDIREYEKNIDVDDWVKKLVNEAKIIAF